MPCYNQHMNKEAFFDEKYKKPTFVYAGSLEKWQCIEKTLSIFKKVHEKIPNAEMYLYTSEKEKAYKLIEQFHIKNINVDYVPYEILNERIQSFKYGFLIRENVSVNQVATPTKMNGYLANGVIPIYSNIIGSFQENLKGGYLIDVENEKDAVTKIVSFESNQISSEELWIDYSKYFNEFYNDAYYIFKIQEKMTKFNVI